MIASSSLDNWVGLGLSLVAIVYLVLVVVFPERF